jgi:VIT1/CCC1 family predicted Fe2+/Mn2+ transporter
MSAAASAPSTPADHTGFRRLWRVLKQLFYEVVGALFAVLSFVWLSSAYRAWTRDVAHWLIAVAVAAALLFAFFAVSSFRRARRL